MGKHNTAIDEMKRLVRQIIREEKTTFSFIKNDEVYRVGETEPLGMVVGFGPKNVIVRRHVDSREIHVDPNELYLGRDWHQYNRK